MYGDAAEMSYRRSPVVRIIAYKVIAVISRWLRGANSRLLLHTDRGHAPGVFADDHIIRICRNAVLFDIVDVLRSSGSDISNSNPLCST